MELKEDVDQVQVDVKEVSVDQEFKKFYLELNIQLEDVLQEQLGSYILTGETKK